MLKPHSNPDGYKKLLVYQKADELQAECRKLTRQFPKTKTMIDLADQMDRSARSTKQNIVEGWKRNTTKEYFDFLGFSLAASAELQEDCDDILKERYPELTGIKGVMGERGARGNPSTPLSPSSPFSLPFDIEKIPFYPLDKTLPPIVQLKLRAKELNFLIHKLQLSLETKMEQEKTMPRSDMARKEIRDQKNKEDFFQKMLKEKGFRRMENGQIVSIENNQSGSDNTPPASPSGLSVQ